MKIPRWLWLKKYFDTGFNLLSYVKYVVAIVGISSFDWKMTFYLGVAFGLLCFITGWLWVKYKYVDMENEINNILNPFQRDVRKKL